MQKRGEIIDAEHWENIRKTYPMHPLTMNEPKFRTKTELDEHRKLERKMYIEQRNKEWAKKNPHEVLITYVPNEFYKQAPNFNTRTEMINL